MFNKKAYAVQMSYEVNDEEKHQATRALLCFEHSVKALDLASDHLNMIKTPFKDNPNIPPEDIFKARAALRRFRDKAVDNFNEFKKISFKCIKIMQNFSSDTQTIKLIKSFISSVDDLQKIVNELVNLFNDLKSKEFSTKVVSSIEKIQKQCEVISDIVEERIKSHIENNIIATNWVDSVGNELQMKIEKKTPLIVDLFNKRQDQLNEIMQEKSTNT